MMRISQPGNAKALIHFNPAKDEYSVTEDELKLLGDLGKSNWKDYCLICIPLFVSCILNGASLIKRPWVFSAGIFINFLIAGISLVLSIIFGLFWKTESKEKQGLLDEIKNKPLYQADLSYTSDDSVTKENSGE